MKRIMVFLIAAVVLCMAAVPVSAALYPSDVATLESGGSFEIRKTYRLMPGDSPDDIDTGDFTRGGIAYTFAELLKEETEITGARPHAETVSIPSTTKDLDKVLGLFDSTLDVDTEDGYIGTLFLDHTSIKIEADGYKSSSYSVTATRTYPNLSDADVSLIPKTTDEKGRTLELDNVTWTETEGGYSATATYAGKATSQTVTGYTVTAEYTGTIYLTAPGPTVYTAIFESVPQPQAEPEATEPLTVPQPEPVAMTSGSKYLFASGMLLVAFVLVYAVWRIRKRRSR